MHSVTSMPYIAKYMGTHCQIHGDTLPNTLGHIAKYMGTHFQIHGDMLQTQKIYIQHIWGQIAKIIIVVYLFVCLFLSQIPAWRMTPRSATSEMCVLHQKISKIWQAPKNTLMEFSPLLCMPLKQQYILPWEVAP